MSAGGARRAGTRDGGQAREGPSRAGGTRLQARHILEAPADMRAGPGAGPSVPSSLAQLDAAETTEFPERSSCKLRPVEVP